MPLLVTPRQLADRSEFYHQLGALTAAGISVLNALESIRRAPPASSFRPLLSRLIHHLQQGATLSESFSTLGRWMPSFDIALVRAGENSGRLDAVFRLLAGYYHERSQLIRSVIADLLYPIFLFHFAFLLLPVTALQRLVLKGDLFGFLWQKLAFFLPFYAAVLLLIWACQSRHGESWRAALEAILQPVPLLGAARRNLALARLAAALEALINAGVSIIDAWDLAATASGSPAIRRAVFSWKPKVLSGQTPAEAVSQSPVFPELFANLYQTGELSGQLDETLRRLHNYYQDEGSRQLKLVAQWTPKLVYLIIVGVIAYQILSFWTGYFQSAGKAMEL
jgi:type II secretory pathway component PulF